MSREVDKSDLSELSEEDLKYLHDRSEITTQQFAEALEISVSDLKGALTELTQRGIPLEERTNTGTANTANLDDEGYRRQLQERNEKDPDADEEDDEDEEDEEILQPPYDREGVTNDDLRVELSRRELSLSGNKQEMIQRLIDDDEAEEEEEDEEEEDEEQ